MYRYSCSPPDRSLSSTHRRGMRRSSLARAVGKLQGEIMQLSSDVRQTLLKRSGHFIQREQPELIVAAIRQMVEQVRGQNPGVMAFAQPASDLSITHKSVKL